MKYVILIAILLSSLNLHAISVKQAVKEALQNYPELNIELENALIAKEDIDQAWSGYRPNISASARVGYLRQDVKNSDNSELNPKNYSINATQPIFRSGRTWNLVKQEKLEYKAQNYLYEQAEQVLIYNVAISYLDLLTNKKILRSRQNNQNVLNKRLNDVSARFDAGELTKTDLSQAESRLAEAIAQTISAKGDVDSQKADLSRYIGKDIGNTIFFNINRNIAKNYQANLARMNNNNLEIKAFEEFMQASKYAKKSAFADFLPEVNLELEASDIKEQSTFFGDRDEIFAGVVVSIPIYQKGETNAEYKKAKRRERIAEYELELLRKDLKAQMMRIWQNYVSALSRTKSFKKQIESSTIALEGVIEEEKAGERTILDTLDAEQELLDAKVNLITAERDLTAAKLELFLINGELALSIF